MHRFLLPVLILVAVACFLSGRSLAEPSSNGSSGIRAFALRLRPGQDLKQELTNFARANNLRAAVVLTCVGSLKHAVIRFADQHDGTALEGKFEIVSLVGTLAADGAHLHLSISDGTGRTIGGHLMEGCIVYTTAEIGLAEMDGLAFTRETDPETTFKELVIHPR